MARNNIGTEKEASLHAALKEWYAEPGDAIEVEIDKFFIDIVRGQLLIEIQTANFYSLKSKLRRLLPDFKVRVVHPIPRERWIRRVSKKNLEVGRRKSPKRGRPEEIFNQLVSLVELLNHDNLQLEVLMIGEEVTWRDDGQGSWRRKRWSIADRRLLEVQQRLLFENTSDLLEMIPSKMKMPFTNKDLSRELAIDRRIAERMTYCLRKMGLLEQVGHKKRFNLYSIL